MPKLSMQQISRRLVPLFIAVLFSFHWAIAQQTKIAGYVYTASGHQPIEGVEISLADGSTNLLAVTDRQGYYVLPYLKDGNYAIVYRHAQYIDKKVTVTLPPSDTLLPEVLLDGKETNKQNDDYRSDLSAFVVEEISGASEESEGMISTFLTASRDPYNNKAGYQFSPVRFRIRGYDAPYQGLYLNGMQMNNMSNGYNAYFLWNGLNNITVNQDGTDGLLPSSYTFGDVGGTVNIITLPSQFSQGSRVTYSLSNRSYTHRTMFTHSTGVLPSGWAITLSLSKRWGDSGYAEGTFYDAYGYFLGVEKQFGRRHSLALIALAAPTKRGVASGVTQEVYELTGNNFYNPNIGMQNGKWRNARVRDNFEPLFQLLHTWNIADGYKLTSGVTYRFGYSAYSALNWHNAPDPRPDYYRNLPSYYSYMTSNPDPETEQYYRDLWAEDPNVSHINWDRMYDVNRNNYVRLYNAKGDLLAEGRRSEYVVEDRHTDQKQWNVSSVLNAVLSENIKLNAGANYRFNRTHNYNVVKDLLGGDFWYDIDKFSERDFPDDPSKAQLDLNNPDRIVRVGDIYSHNYYGTIQNAQLWATLSAYIRHFDFYLALDGGWTGMFRDGKQRRGLFPENSYGKSDILNFFEYGVKGGATWKINGRNFVQANGAYLSHAPYFSSLFISPRTRNSYVENPQNEKIASGDISYIVRHPFIKGRITFYYTQFMDGTRNMSFYDDGYRAFSNYVLTNIDRRHMGVELGAEVKITPSLTATGVFSYGSYIYTNNPDYLQTVDNSNKVLEQESVYWSQFHVSGTPQMAANLSLQYQTPFYVWLGIDANYFGRGYLDANPMRRTDKAYDGLPEEFVAQEQFKGGFTLDANVGWSYRISSGKYLRLNLSVTNILNKTDLRTGGYEQLRIRYDKEGKMMRPFDPRYFYMYGTNFYLNVALLF